MILKTDQRFLGETNGVPHIMPLEMHDSSFIKQSVELPPEIEKYINNARPIPGKNILLIDALGAGEIWGANVNGDWYGRDELMREDNDAGYRSFMYHAYPYKHHQNEGRARVTDRGQHVVLHLSLIEPKAFADILQVPAGIRNDDLCKITACQIIFFTKPVCDTTGAVW